MGVLNFNFALKINLRGKTLLEKNIVSAAYITWFTVYDRTPTDLFLKKWQKNKHSIHWTYKSSLRETERNTQAILICAIYQMRRSFFYPTLPRNITGVWFSFQQSSRKNTPLFNGGYK